MKKGLTELVFILDRSGSMAGLESDTIGGFNSMLTRQKKVRGSAYVTTVLFDGVVEMLHDRKEIRSVSPMTNNDYYVRGCTALLDAIGLTIEHIAMIHKYSRPEDVPERTMFVIITDGMENASGKFSSDEVRRMIEKEKSKYGWEFLFLAANIDAVSTAKSFGIDKNRAVNYCPDRAGTALNYSVINDAVSCVRMAQPLTDNWGKRIDEDYQRRNTK